MDLVGHDGRKVLAGAPAPAGERTYQGPLVSRGGWSVGKPEVDLRQRAAGIAANGALRDGTSMKLGSRKENAGKIKIERKNGTEKDRGLIR